MNKEILRLAVPNILSNISIPLISTVDTILMGHLSSIHLGAVGVGAMIFNFVYWNFGFLRMGTTGITAQAFGEQSSDKILDTLLRASFTALGIALILIVFAIPICNSSLWAMNIGIEQEDLVKEYFFIRLAAAPASLLIYVISGWYFGLQDAITPLKMTLAVNISNILISIVLVKYMNMGLRGVAWGTVVAQYIGVFVALGFLFTKYKHYFNHLVWSRLWNRVDFLGFLNINRDIFLRTIFLATAFFFFHSQSAKDGALFLAVNVILIQLINWMSYGVDGFAFAAESMVGKYVGAKDAFNVRRSIKYAMYWGLALAVVYSAVYGFFYQPIIEVFNKEVEVWELASSFRWLVVLLPIIAFACYMWDGIFVGMTASKSMRNSMFFAFILYIGLYYALEDIFPIYAIWIALFVFLFSRGVFQTYLFKKYGLDLK